MDMMFFIYFKYRIPYAIFTGTSCAEYYRKEISIMQSSDLIHELAMLYLQKTDIPLSSPSELLDKYKRVYQEIEEHYAKNFNIDALI